MAQCCWSTWSFYLVDQFCCSSIVCTPAFPAGQGRRTFPSAQHLCGCTWSTGSSSGLPCAIEMWTYRRAVKGLEHLSCEEAQGDVSCLCKHLKGDYSENRAGLSAVVPRARTRGRGQKPEHGRLPLNTCSSTLVLCRWQSAGMDCPKRLWALLLRDLQKHLGTVLWVYLLEQGLGRVDPEVSALLRPAVIL